MAIYAQHVLGREDQEATVTLGPPLSRKFTLLFDAARPGLKVTSHVERLAASKCKQATGDPLCGTCHNLHTGADHSQQACLGCRASCADCHMPRTPTTVGNHGAMTAPGARLSRNRVAIAHANTSCAARPAMPRCCCISQARDANMAHLSWTVIAYPSVRPGV